MPMQAAEGIEMHEIAPGVHAGRFAGYLAYEERLQQLRVPPQRLERRSFAALRSDSNAGLSLLEPRWLLC